VTVKAVLPADESLDIALDKHQTWKLATDLGIPTPECDLIESLDRLFAVIQYPIVLKSTSSLLVAADRAISGEVALIDHSEGRLDFLRRYLPYGPIQ